MLEDVIRDYNSMFGTSYDTSADQFQSYYKHLSERLKYRELDIVIVVNMFLTGFDATTLNTLWVDKNLRAHGLIQAYSRTNRILNSVKTYGNVVSFRNLEQETNDALALFGNRDAKGVVLLRPYAEYHEEYHALVEKLVAMFPAGQPIVGEEAQKEFIRQYGAILRLRNILTSFDDFTDDHSLSDRDLQDYQSTYLDIYAEFRKGASADKEHINDDVVFEIELIKQVEINVDYILMLVEQYMAARGSAADNEIRATIDRAVNASVSLRNKKDLIEDFVNSVTITHRIDDEWSRFVAERREQELEQIITEERLNPEEARTYMANAFRDGQMTSAGTALTNLLPPVSRFSKNNDRGRLKQHVLDRLLAFFERFNRLG